MPDDEDLFAGLEGVAARPPTYVHKTPEQRPVGHAGCPQCTNEKVGLVRQGPHLAYKNHWVSTWGGTSRQCTAGGQRLCDLPARDVRSLTGSPTPICICKRGTT